MGGLNLSSCCPSLFKKKPEEEQEDDEFGDDTPSPYAVATIEAPKCSRSFKDTRYWRKKTLKAVRSVDIGGDVVISVAKPINDKEYVKVGLAVQLSEAAALRYVAEHTSIPVPKVYCAFTHGRMNYILMERIDGEDIGLNWANRTDVENQDLLDQLKIFFEELRNIPHPRPGVLAAADMQALYDHRTFKGRFGFGPFATEQDFNNFLHAGMQRDHNMLRKKYNPWVTDKERSELQKLLDLHDKCQHNICFTHGDVSSSNILVKDGKVVGLIDFELAGFYPEYWEFTTAMNVNRYDGFWKAEIPKFMKGYPEELEMEKLRRKHFGPRGFRRTFLWG